MGIDIIVTLVITGSGIVWGAAKLKGDFEISVVTQLGELERKIEVKLDYLTTQQAELITRTSYLERDLESLKEQVLAIWTNNCSKRD